MKTTAVLATLAVSALLLGLATASCPCALSGKSVCGGGSSGCGAVVRPAPFIPAPRPQPQVVVRREYVVVEQQQQEEAGCYNPAPKPAPKPHYVARSEPEPCYVPPQAAPEPEIRTVYVPVVPAAQPAPRIIYKAAPAPKIVYRPAPAPQPVCNSCYKPASSCGCN